MTCSAAASAFSSFDASPQPSSSSSCLANATPALPAVRTHASSSSSFLPGAIAGAANIIVGFPFDTVKVHLQAGASSKGSLQVAADIFRRHGVTGFFRGASAPVLGGALECGVNYMVYSGMLKALAGERGQPSVPETAAAAAVAGAALSFILAPAELIKCRLQLRQAHYRSPLECVRLTVREEGVKGLCRGLGATLAREVPGNAIFFTSYEVIKAALQGPREHAPAMQDASTLDWVKNAATMILAGGLAGSLFWAAILPIDTVKTRIQAALPGSKHDVGLIAHLRALANEGGVRAMWRGVLPAMVRAFPANAAQWLTWELLIAMQEPASQHQL